MYVFYYAVPYNGITSQTQAIPITLSVKNSKTETVYLWWVNYSGAVVFWDEIYSGETSSLPTYATHPWIISTYNGYVLGCYILYEDTAITVSD